MISQKIGLQILIPLALEKLQDDIFIETDFYYRDLLSNILTGGYEIYCKIKNDFSEDNFVLFNCVFILWLQ